MEIVVVGAGISGLSTAYAIEKLARERGVDATVRVLEAEPRLGGKVDTRRVDGFVIEGGVNGWLDSKPSTDELCRELGIHEERLPSNDASRRRFIFRRGRLHQLPESPGAFLKSGLMGFGGKLRLAMEPFARRRPDGDETLAEFARRRLGREALDALLDPMVSGIFAGDPERMSLMSCFPRIAEIEAEHGGLIKGMMRIGKERRRARREGEQAASAGPAGPGGRLISFASGTGRLIEALARALAHAPETSAPVTRVERRGAAWALRLEDGRCVEAERVVLATPAWAAARMLDPLDTTLGTELAAIPYAAVSVVALAWKREAMPHALDGFGFLIPHSEGREILGTLWDSSVFLERAPDGYVLTRSMVGGMRQGELARRSESELVKSARRELGQVLGVEAAPDVVQVVRHDRAIPQYLPGHAARLARIEERLEPAAGLLLTGNAYRGVGLNDCTRNAVVVAAAALGIAGP